MARMKKRYLVEKKFDSAGAENKEGEKEWSQGTSLEGRQLV
jgi:hypothetical protein